MHAIQMIPVDQIHVLNPRVRNQRVFRQIVDNIEAIGLKRPITVSRHQQLEGMIEYDLVCGQGRLEAYQALGRTEIPAIVISARKDDCLIMSLVENIARRQHPAIELMRDIEGLHQRGYDETQIAQKLGVTASWVSMLLGLLEHGEERLVAAVEAGLIPVSLAVTIARSDDAGVQEALADAYTQGLLKGKKLTLVRRLLHQRAHRGKHERSQHMGKKGSGKLNAEKLLRIYQREVDKQKLLMRQADITQKRLLFVTRALQTLLDDSTFVALLREEGMSTIPAPLEERIGRGSTL
jgi:ParB family chromosome partitioning protein